MEPKPPFLGRQTAIVFQNQSVAEAYQLRPPYPDAVFDILASLVVDQPRHVLDVGCGTGFIARRLIGRVAHIDAVDISLAMIERGQLLPGGGSPMLSWILGSAEDAPLNPPYALIAAGDSLHWMDWAVVMPRFAAMLTPNGYLAILGVDQTATPWDDELLPIIVRYSTIAGYRPYDVVEELESRELLQTTGRQVVSHVPFTQPLDAYIESFHGRASFSRERMGLAAAKAFDTEVRALVSRYAPHDVSLQVMTEVVWGRPRCVGE